MIYYYNIKFFYKIPKVIKNTSINILGHEKEVDVSSEKHRMFQESDNYVICIVKRFSLIRIHKHSWSNHVKTRVSLY